MSLTELSRLVERVSRRAPLAAIVLILGIALTAGVWYQSRHQIIAHARFDFDRDTHRISKFIKQRIQIYTNVLYGLRGLFDVNETVDHEAFRRYVSSLDLEQNYPGFRAFTYARVLTLAQKQSFERTVRQTKPDFAIKPPGDRPEYFVVQFVEPLAENEVLIGFDLGSEKKRRAGVEFARDSGDIAATEGIKLVVDTTGGSAVVMRLAIYESDAPVETIEQRRRAFRGLVNVAFRVDKIVNAALAAQLLGPMRFRIHDRGPVSSAEPRPISPDNLLFDSDGLRSSNTTATTETGGALANNKPYFTKTSALNVGARRWDLHFSVSDESLGYTTSMSKQVQPLIILFGGGVLSLALFGLVRTMGRSERNSLTMASRMTEELRASEERFRGLTELSSDWYWEQDEKYRFTYVSEGLPAKTGLSEEYFLGKTRWELPIAGLSAKEMENHKVMLEARQPFRDLVYQWTDSRSEVEYISVSGRPVFDDDGVFRGYRGVASDITAAKFAERELRQSEARFRSLTELSSDWYWEQDADYRFTLLMRDHTRATSLSFSSAESLGKTRWELPHEDMEEEIWLQHKALLEAREPFYDLVVKRPDGEGGTRYSCINGVPIFDTEGVFQGYRGIGRDITETVQKEETIRRANQALTAVIETSPIAIYTMDLDGLVTRWNAAAERMFGWTEEEVLGRTLPFVPENKKHESQILLGRNKRGEPLNNVELVRERRDGSPVIINTSTAPLNDADGTLTGILALATDITERKQAETRNTAEHAVTKILARSITPGQAMGEIVEALCLNLGWVCGAYWSLYGQEHALRCSATWSQPLPELVDFLEHSRKRIDAMQRSSRHEKGGIVRRVWSSREPYWGADITKDNTIQRAPIAEKAGLRSTLAFPVQSDDRMFGILELFHHDARPPDEAMLKKCRAIGQQLGWFLQRKQTEARQSMGHAVTETLAESASTKEAIPRILQTICQTLGWECGSFWEFDEVVQHLHCSASWCTATPAVEQFIARSRVQTFVPGSVGLIRRAWSNRAPIWIPDITEESSFVRSSIAREAGLHAAFAFPMIEKNECVGVMEFFSYKIQQPEPRLMQNVEGIGRQIAQFYQRRKAEELVQYLAYHDPLTNLPNRTFFNQLLDYALVRARRNNKGLAILFLDLDRFKNINDTLGHESGDCVLQAIAQRIRGALRETDLLARQGGDEFIVMVDELYRSWDAAKVAQQLLTLIAEPVTIAEREYHITASIGISYYPNDAEDAPTLLKHADIAMYRAKDYGKNNYQLYSSQMTSQPLRAQLELESDLRHALQRNELTLFYQPKVNVKNKEITGVEALVRWQHPKEGIITPANFISLAEETGLIIPLGRWVLQTACSQMVSWMEQGLPTMRLSVNLSPRQFADGKLLTDIESVIKSTGIDGRKLEIEITESTVMRNPDQTAHVLLALKDKGVYVSIDDFGTAYSSLSYLKKFPIDIIKIDRSFINGVPKVEDDMVITQTIITMAHKLKLNVIAEGVETVEQLRFLCEHGCDEMQGYYFSKPLPEDQLIDFIKNYKNEFYETARGKNVTSIK